MRAKVNEIFLDRERNELLRIGQVVEVAYERYAELNERVPGALTALDRQAPTDAGASEQPDACAPAGDGGSEESAQGGPIVDPEPDGQPAERPDLDEMTCEQLRAYIASKGGEVPAKAKRPQLDAIARAL